ncbi:MULTISPECIES: IcmT/TraK family protein [Candidatus Regiella]|uniref:Conjugal transfer protein TraK n=1 Tax=Candidatus Regiella insecticola TaxID=138073 RepID=A0A6L2ZR60_9ENTR|nr:IcmT/TraK family protein [Candidatus Regiella insecticola]GFN47256.1 conjugal transfer protein TraK [Candidatus Regiella insecticola]
MDISPWRDASRPLTIFGIPALLLTLYFAWFRWPTLLTLTLCTALILFFKVLSIFGYTLTILTQRLLHLMRGNPVLGRPWWYRKFFE